MARSRLRTDMIYGQKQLIETFIQVHGVKQPHEKFVDYYAELLEKLQNLFEINLEPEGVKNKQYKALWMLFRSAAKAYGSISHPLDGYLESGLIIKHMFESDAQGSSIEKYLKLTFETKKAHQESCYQLLEELFTVLWGILEQKFTSQDLKSLGFYDSRKRHLEIYSEDL
jgi:hypothetical protein